MKIAFVGKGGSGKSSISWLAVKTLEDMGTRVLAIDADHNMDMTSNLGLDPSTTPLMHRTEKEFMEASGVLDTSKVSNLLCADTYSLATFTTSPQDIYTDSITTKVSRNISLINIGLGSPDVMFSGKCAHGLSGPLKYYLGLLEEGDDFVIIDSVAGADMLNYGLYAGIDAVICVVEPHRNSIKVFEQIAAICKKSMLPCYVVINKPSESELYKDFILENKDEVLGEIPFDEEVMTYDYTKVRVGTKEAMKGILSEISKLKKRGNLTTIRTFQEMKQGTDSGK